jgi:hypothetical protein
MKKPILADAEEAAQEIGAPAEPMRDQLSWEEIRALVWSLPMTKAARQIGITNTALRKKCFRMKIDAPPQGYWQTPPANRAIFLERTNRSHESESEAPLKLPAA